MYAPTPASFPALINEFNILNTLVQNEKRKIASLQNRIVVSPHRNLCPIWLIPAPIPQKAHNLLLR